MANISFLARMKTLNSEMKRLYIGKIPIGPGSGETVTMTFRTTAGIREAIKEDASVSDKSITAWLDEAIMSKLGMDQWAPK